MPATRPARPRADERVSKQSLDPLSELIYTILSQNTSDANSRPAFEKLVQRFPDWDAARRARTSSIKAAIRRGGLANQKAPRIKNLLEEIHHEHGKLTLDHVKKMSDEEAVAYLTGFHGVGRKTAACVLMFSLGRPVLPVDTHVHRVAKRLGLIPEKATADQAHDLLQKQVRDRQVADFHVLLVRHGRRICKAQRPLCLECPLLSGCPHGQQRLATGEAAPDERYDKGREAADGSVPHVSPAGSRGSRRTR